MPANSSGDPGIPPASPVVAPSNPLRNDDPQEPRLAPPQESAIPLVPEKPAGPTIRSTQKPISDSSPQASSLETSSDSTMSTSCPPAERTVKLTAALYGVPAGGTSPLRLIDCLRTAPAGGRAKIIAAYWNVRQIAAQQRSLGDQIQWLEALAPTAAAENPPAPMAILKLRAARLAVDAERADGQADCTVAQFDLAALAGLETSKSLPQPVSLPSVGRPPLLASSGSSVGILPANSSVGILPANSSAGLASASSVRPWSQQRLEATLPQRQQAILDQAAAVIEADGLRTQATADFLAGRSSVERVLTGITVQASETAAFLRSVTEYNRDLAQYATIILPANTEAEKLAAALAVE